MATPIEIVNAHDQGATHEAARSVYANTLPGFQVDGVRNYQELGMVLDGLKLAAPHPVQNQIRFNHVTRAYEDLNFSELHSDNSLVGLAVHHNVTGVVPVKLVIVDDQEIETFNRVFPLDIYETHNTVEGETIPGRLTIFSCGNLGSIGLMTTAHRFDRSEVSGISRWARYASISPYSPRSILDKSLRRRWVAERTLSLSKAQDERQAA